MTHLPPSTFHLPPCRCRGQTWIEYAVVMAALVSALLVMQRSLKASVMGRWRAVADTFGGGQQFEPGVSVMTVEP